MCFSTFQPPLFSLVELISKSTPRLFPSFPFPLLYQRFPPQITLLHYYFTFFVLNGVGSFCALFHLYFFFSSFFYRFLVLFLCTEQQGEPSMKKLKSPKTTQRNSLPIGNTGTRGVCCTWLSESLRLRVILSTFSFNFMCLQCGKRRGNSRTNMPNICNVFKSALPSF